MKGPGGNEGNILIQNLDNHRPAGFAIELGQITCAILDDGPGPDLDEGGIHEYYQQNHVLGWSWLGLPPLEPEKHDLGRMTPTKKKDLTDPEGWPDLVWKDRHWWRRLLGENSLDELGKTRLIVPLKS